MFFNAPRESVEINLPYEPRSYQAEFEKAMFNGCRRALLLWHRRAGKDITCLNFMINEMLKKIGVYYYFLPSFKQGRKVIWDGIDERGFKMIDYFPKQIIDGKPNKTEMKIHLKNGSLFQIIGTDNFDSVAGTNPCGVVFSEYSLQDPNAWELIVSPILRKNGGWAVFNFTARGHNHAYELYRMATNNPRWFVQTLTVEDTGLISKESLDEERAEGKSEELIQQEYYCSFSRGIEGTYYGRLIDKARLEGRITKIPYQGGPVYTYWDLGFGDSTVIIFAYFVGQEIHVLDYYEAHGEGLNHYAKVLDDKRRERGFVYGTHYAPHDVENGSLQTGMSLKQYARELGIEFQTIPRTAIDFGIEAVRGIFPRLWFDDEYTKHLQKCLENYQKRYNDKLKVYSTTPLHNQFSHGADAMRMLAVAHNHFGKGSQSMTAQDIINMRRKYQGY